MVKGLAKQVIQRRAENFYSSVISRAPWTDLLLLPSFADAVGESGAVPTAATAAPSRDNVDIVVHHADHGYQRVRYGGKTVDGLRPIDGCGHRWMKAGLHDERHDKSDDKCRRLHR